MRSCADAGGVTKAGSTVSVRVRKRRDTTTTSYDAWWAPGLASIDTRYLPGTVSRSIPTSTRQVPASTLNGSTLRLNACTRTV